MHIYNYRFILLVQKPNYYPLSRSQTVVDTA